MSTNISPAPVQVPSSSPLPDASEAAALSRRRFLRTAAVTGTGLVAVGLAACAPSGSTSTWSQGRASRPPPRRARRRPPLRPRRRWLTGRPSHPLPHPPGPPMDHDANALAAVERFLGGEGASLDGQGNVPLEPRVEGGARSSS